MSLPLLLLACQMAPQQASPMVEHTRAHTRMEKVELGGERRSVKLGSILLPVKPKHEMPLVIHFHGTPWLVEQEVRRAWPEAAVLAVQAGSGSGVYRRAVEDPAVFQEIVDQKWKRIVLTGWSAGYGAIREILRRPQHARFVDAAILLDGMHADRETMDADVGPFLDYAREASRGRHRMLVTHSEVYPGTYASTTETADWLVDKLGVRRKAVLRWGPLGMQQVSEAKTGRFRLLGFAGNSAPDHVDHLQALARWIQQVRRATWPGIWGRL